MTTRTKAATALICAMATTLLLFSIGCAHHGCNNTTTTTTSVITETNHPVVAPETIKPTKPQSNSTSSMTHSTFNTENYVWDNWDVK